MNKLTRFIFSLLILITVSTNAIALNRVQLSAEYFPNPIASKALSNANIYVGIPDTDPEVVANRKTVSALQENGSIVALTQPVKTGLGGIPVYNGSPVTLLVDGQYSVKVTSSTGTQLYYIPVNYQSDDSPVVKYVSDIASLRTTQSEAGDGETIYLVCHTTNGDGGHGTFYWDASSTAADDNGVTIAVTGVATGRWVRQLNDFVTPEMFGGDIQASVDSGYTVKLCAASSALTAPLLITTQGQRIFSENGAKLTYSIPTDDGILISADDVQIKGIVIEAPAVFDLVNAAPTYGVIRTTGKNTVVENCHLINVPKVGLFAHNADKPKFRNNIIEGNVIEGSFTGPETGHFGICVDSSPSDSQGLANIYGNYVKGCVQGCFIGNYGAASREQSIIIASNNFEECWNHGVYGAGMAHGINVVGNTFSRCQVPIALTGRYHVVNSNTLYTHSTGTYTDITGISIRGGYGCDISHNVIKGDGAMNGSVIAITPLIAFDISNNNVSDNLIECEVGSSIAIIVGGAAATAVENNTVSRNRIKCAGRDLAGLIQIVCSGAGNNNRGNAVLFNTITAKSPSYGITLSDCHAPRCIGNEIRFEYDAVSTYLVYGILVGGQTTKGHILNNNVIVDADWGMNLTVRGIGETPTVGQANKYRGNTTSFDMTKLAGAIDYFLTAASLAIVDHEGTGAPAIACAAGSRFWRTDGGALTTLYVKESGTAATGWIGK